MEIISYLNGMKLQPDTFWQIFCFHTFFVRNSGCLGLTVLQLILFNIYQFFLFLPIRQLLRIFPSWILSKLMLDVRTISHLWYLHGFLQETMCTTYTPLVVRSVFLPLWFLQETTCITYHTTHGILTITMLVFHVFLYLNQTFKLVVP